jgi:TonB family protein
MRFRGTFLLLTALAIPVISHAQDAQPFAAVDAAFKKDRLRWSLASGPFQSVRTQLGANFEPELWKYLADDVDKQDRIANFLIYPDYLHGNLPMPDLARRIQLRSLSLLAGKSDLSSRTAFVTASINAAVQSAELELIAEARQHKNDVEKMLAADRFLVTAVPAMADYDSCIYDAIGDPKIGSPAAACKPKKASTGPVITMIEMGEIPQQKVISKPEPQWKKETKTGTLAGILKVQVVIDESGRVESAEIVDGPSVLQEAALAAARKARFQQTMYQGQPEKIRGWLTYSYGMG